MKQIPTFLNKFLYRLKKLKVYIFKKVKTMASTLSNFVTGLDLSRGNSINNTPIQNKTNDDNKSTNITDKILPASLDPYTDLLFCLKGDKEILIHNWTKTTRKGHSICFTHPTTNQEFIFDDSQLPNKLDLVEKDFSTDFSKINSLAGLKDDSGKDVDVNNLTNEILNETPSAIGDIVFEKVAPKSNVIRNEVKNIEKSPDISDNNIKMNVQSQDKKQDNPTVAFIKNLKVKENELVLNLDYLAPDFTTINLIVKDLDIEKEELKDIQGDIVQYIIDLNTQKINDKLRDVLLSNIE